ncbi:MAG: Flp family type IVb pilin [Planctomycetaceae bacterium]|nr:Flp family type IVb pilin [Planctomycetaceae bacterium]
MKAAIARLTRFIRDEDGPTAVEYAVMLSLILMVCFTAIRTLGVSTAGRWSNVSSTVISATK